MKKKIAKKIKKAQWKAPKIVSLKENKDNKSDFPVKHYSYSFFTKMSTNPFMAKINYLNGDYIDSTTSVSGVLGKACHKALQAYLGGNPDIPTSSNEGDAIKLGHDVGLEFLKNYEEGYIDYNKTITNRTTLEEKYAFCYFNYIKESSYKDREILIVERKLEHKIEVNGKVLPIPLKGYPDVVYRDEKGRICIDDHKFTYAYSKEDELDGEKLIQSIFLFFLVYAEIGEAPYKVTFREFKTSKNKDNSPQTKEFPFIYSEIELAFDLFYRFYADVTDSLMGKQVYLPNFKTFYDNEVSILAYIHRLDVDEERAKKFKEAKVENITDFLKKRISSNLGMKKYLETVATKFISAKTMNYKDKKIEERIKMKLAEHGIGLEFDSMVIGSSITLYRYEPSIGIKMSKLASFVQDIEQVVGVTGIRILAPIPNSDLIGFEIPNKDRKFFKNTLKSDNLIIGLDTMGNPVKLIIEEMPHLLIAGASGSGKSVFLNEVIRQTRGVYDQIIIDPKGIEFPKGIIDHKEVANKLSEIVLEMKDRYSVMKKAKVKKWSDTGNKSKIIIIDEYNDLYMSKEKMVVGQETVTKMYAKGEKEMVKDIEDTVGNVIDRNIKILAQKARSAGIHIFLATQRPSVKVLDGDIKSNFPTRISFKLPTITDSRVILDVDGAEKLLGKGDGLLLNNGETIRFQAFNI